MELRQRIEKYSKWIMLAAVLLLVFLVVLVIVSSMPPRRFTILTGREGGAYHEAALQYRAIAQEKGFDLEIQPTAGSMETLALLEAGEAEIGFVQGGIAVNSDPQLLNSMASLFYEPVWVFYNPDHFDEPLTRLPQLEGKVVAIGEIGSGANQLAQEMLAANRIDAANTTLLALSSAEAANRLRDGSVHAAFFVSAPGASLIQELLADRALELMSFDNAAAYSAQFPYLTTLVLPEGAIDLRENIPAEDKHLVSTVANLIVRTDFHPDLLRLMTIAVVDSHADGGLFEERFEFPNFDHTDLPIDPEERAYLERIRGGESALDNYLPFWAAALIDRYLLFVLPIALLLLPIVSRSPVLITVYNRRKITRWYRVVRNIDRRVSSMDVDEIDRALAELEDIEQRLREQVNVSDTYMAEHYDLRGHIDLIQDRLLKRRATLSPAEEADPVAQT